MKAESSHKTNKWIIAAMLGFFLFGISLLFLGCNAAKINRSTRKTADTSEKKTNEEESRTRKSYDFSVHTQEDYRLSLIPMDPSKQMGVKTDPNTGEKTYTNAIPVYEASKKQTDTNITEETDQTKTTDTTENSKATTDETTKKKTKLSVPWYALAIIGFFAFATIVALFLIYLIAKRLKTPAI